MARYKTIDRHPRLIAISLDAQLLPGTVEHTLDYLIYHEMDFSAIDALYRSNDVGASACTNPKPAKPVKSRFL